MSRASTSSLRSGDYGDFRSDVRITINSLRSALHAFSSEYTRTKTLSHASILSDLIALSDASGCRFLEDEARWDARGMRNESRSRAYADRRWRRQSAKFEEQLHKLEDEGWPGWSMLDRQVVQEAWRREPKSLIELAQGMGSVLDEIKSGTSVSRSIATIAKTSDATSRTTAVETTTPAGTSVKAVTTTTSTDKSKASDKSEAKA